MVVRYEVDNIIHENDQQILLKDRWYYRQEIKVRVEDISLGIVYLWACREERLVKINPALYHLYV